MARKKPMEAAKPTSKSAEKKKPPPKKSKAKCADPNHAA